MKALFFHAIMFLFACFYSVAELMVNVYQTQKNIHNVIAKLYGGVEPGEFLCILRSM